MFSHAVGGICSGHTPVPTEPVRYAAQTGRKSWSVLPPGWTPTKVRVAPAPPRVRVREKKDRPTPWYVTHAALVRAEAEREGATISGVAERFGVSHQTIRSALLYAGGTPPRSKVREPVQKPARAPRPPKVATPGEASLLRAWNEGQSISAVAEAFATSRTTARKWLRAAGVQTEAPAARGATLTGSVVRAEYEAGAGLHELAKRHGAGLVKVRQAIIEAGGTIRPYGGPNA